MDEPTFAAFAEEARPRLLRDAHRLCGDWHEAEDLVQTTLERIYARWECLTNHDQLGGYARKALTYIYLNERRRLRWRYEIGLDQLPEIADRPVPLADFLVVRAAVRQLAPRQRAVIALRFWEDLSVQQASDALGCPSGTVTSQTYRALRVLRDALEARD
jgi:RNA polymerase sigma-70 factor (sigma-E family)